jgi:hypothetical protein
MKTALLVITTQRLRLLAATSVFTAAIALSVGAVFAQPVQQARNGRPQWPTHAPYDAAIHAFDSALSRAGWDAAYRKRLIASSESARKAVSDEGNINVPADRVMVFYEPEVPQRQAVALSQTKRRDFAQSRMSEKVHVFVLPPFNAKKKVQYRYEDWFMCCYEWWVRSTPSPTVQPSR